MQYDRINFHMKFATKLLTFKTNKRHSLRKHMCCMTLSELVFLILKAAMGLLISIRLLLLERSIKESQMLIESLSLKESRQSSEFLQRCRVILMEFRSSII